MSSYIYKLIPGCLENQTVIGNKAASILTMTTLGLPVPPAFVISIPACQDYYTRGEILSEELKQEIRRNIHWLEQETEKTFDGVINPLLVSVRSSPEISMPGMLDSILNLGLNPMTIQALTDTFKDADFAYDSYARFLQQYTHLIGGIPEKEIAPVLASLSAKEQTQYIRRLYAQKTGHDIPSDPEQQLFNAIEAIFKSWNNPRAAAYRRIQAIAENPSVAVVVQTMVFGNACPGPNPDGTSNSGTGVVFTRNPSTGEHILSGEYQPYGQGPDIVSGANTPFDISRLANDMPSVYDQLELACNKLEHALHDMQEIEFTIQNRKLYLLQTRTGKRTKQANAIILRDMAQEGIISKKLAEPVCSNNAACQRFDPNALNKATRLGLGIAASPGAVSGRIAMSYQKAKELHDTGEPVILVRPGTDCNDVEAIRIADGVLTASGGLTSHAAVLARDWNKPCITGCETIIFASYNTVILNKTLLHEGDWISIDGTTGSVYHDHIPIKKGD